MRTQPHRYVAALIAALGIALPHSRAGAAEPASSIAPPDRIHWDCPHGHAIGGARVATFQPEGLGRFELSDLDSALHADYDRYLATADGTTLYSELRFSYISRVGQTVPMLDAIYTVGESGPGNAINLTRVTDKDFVKDPTDDRNLVIVPVGTSVRFVFYHDGQQLNDTSTIDVVRVAGDGTKGGVRRAQVSAKNSTPPRDLLAPNNRMRSELAVGDVVPLVLNCQLTVKKIVPPDEQRKILGWVEFDPIPAGQGSTVCKYLFGRPFSDASVGTDPAFEKLMADNHVRKGILAPRGMREFITTRNDLSRIAGPVHLEARVDGHDSQFTWTFDADFRGDGADGMAKTREMFPLPRYRETKWYATQYLSDLRKIRTHATSDTSAIFGGKHDEASISSPEQLAGGNIRAYRQNVVWAIMGRWWGEPPTFRQLLDACPLLKSPYSEKALDAYMDDKPVWSYSTSFCDNPATAGWRVEALAKIRPGLEALLRKLGFVESERTTHIWLLRDPNGTEQHTWERPSDACVVSITPLGDKIAVGYQGPLRQE
jgi:hypothetical protein